MEGSVVSDCFLYVFYSVYLGFSSEPWECPASPTAGADDRKRSPENKVRLLFVQ